MESVSGDLTEVLRLRSMASKQGDLTAPAPDAILAAVLETMESPGYIERLHADNDVLGPTAGLEGVFF
jgi:hypothetical protein